MNLRSLKILILLSTASLIFFGFEGGCITTSQGSHLQNQINTLTSRLQATEKEYENLRASIDSTASTRGGLTGDVLQVQSDLEKLHGAIEDTRFQTEKLLADNQELSASLESTLANLEMRLQVIESKLGLEPPIAADPKPNGPDAQDGKAHSEKDLYEQAQATFKAGQYQSARQLFRAFLKDYSKSKYAGNAQFWIGESYFKQADYDNAILEYDKVISQYPSSNKVAAAYLKMGFSFFELNELQDAKAFFLRVVNDFPDTEQAEIAKRKLKAIP